MTCHPLRLIYFILVLEGEASLRTSSPGPPRPASSSGAVASSTHVGWASGSSTPTWPMPSTPTPGVWPVPSPPTAHSCLTGGVVSVVGDVVILAAVVGDVVILGDIDDIIGVGTVASSSLSSSLSLDIYRRHSPPFMVGFRVVVAGRGTGPVTAGRRR